MSAAVPADEPGRLAALRRLDVLDTKPEEQFDKIVALVRTVLGVPIATVTLVDAHRQWFKARAGMPVAESPRSTSFCTHTVAACAPLMIPDATLDPRVCDSPLVTGEPFVRAYLGVPLLTPDGHAVGALCAIDTGPREFTPAQVEVLAGFARLVVDELELRQVAITDQLTGCLSRRGFTQAVEREIERCRRYGRPASLAILDVDHFKRVNDTHGHSAGDTVLRQLVLRCTAMLRPVDLIGRLGGEEFAILLPEIDEAAAATTIERLRRAVGSAPFEIEAGDALPVTASFGLTALASGDDALGWLQRADTGLYGAKREGRDRLQVVKVRPDVAASRHRLDITVRLQRRLIEIADTALGLIAPSRDQADLQGLAHLRDEMIEAERAYAEHVRSLGDPRLIASHRELAAAYDTFRDRWSYRDGIDHWHEYRLSVTVLMKQIRATVRRAGGNDATAGEQAANVRSAATG